MPRAEAIRHVAFEDLGTFEAVLRARGWEVAYVDATSSTERAQLTSPPELLFVLGGPLSVHDREIFSFLDWERALLADRMRRDLPTIGICLGAQLMSVALGGGVVPMAQKEIGFSPVALTQAGQAGALAALGDQAVLHWHGEQCQLPPEAALLASTPLCKTQAFSYRDNSLALQFHLEADASRLEPWYVGHTIELGLARVKVAELRIEAERCATALRERAQQFLDRWLDERNL